MIILIISMTERKGIAMENKNNMIATEVAQKQQGSSRARFTAYMQGMKKLERKAQMQKEANMKGGAKA